MLILPSPLCQEREARRAKLQDLLKQVPLPCLVNSVPRLKGLLQTCQAEEEASKAEPCEPLECRITSESIADAAEELAKAHFQALEALDGFAVSAALTACELRRKTAEARLAVTGSEAPNSAKPRILDAEAVTKGEAECDLLQRRAGEARDLEETISKRCPQKLASAIQKLYSKAGLCFGIIVKISLLSL